MVDSFTRENSIRQLANRSEGNNRIAVKDRRSSFNYEMDGSVYNTPTDFHLEDNIITNENNFLLL